MDDLFRFDPPADDPLGVLTSTAPVARDNPWVRLEAEAVARFARAHRDAPPPTHREEALHQVPLDPRRYCNYLLALEALNFSFWDEEPRWRVVYGGVEYDGYWALAAALHRAISQDGLPLWEAGFLARLEPDDLAFLLRGSGRPPPLMGARLAHLREVGQVLLARWDGAFANLVAQCGGSAPALVRAIVAELLSFRDEAIWERPEGRRAVRFYKRAQICAVDLARLLPHDPLGRLTGLERLTAFADYKVPQVLRREGILVPAPALAARIDRGEEIAAGGVEEVALRAATLWGCEWIARALTRERASRAGVSRSMAVATTPAEVDYLLWSAGQVKAGLPPYHRTRTIYY